MYLTLQEAKAQCRVDHSDEDTDIILKVQQASSMVKGYLKTTSPFEPDRDDEHNPLYDSNDEPITDSSIVRYEVKAATAIIFQQLYDRTFEASPGYLPDAAVAILYPLRDPTLA